MKTKAVYVVTSQGNDNYLEQLIISTYSFRLHNIGASIILVTDDETKHIIDTIRPDIYQYISNIIAVNIPSQFNQMQKSRYIKTSLREIVSGDYIFVDTDTVVTGSLKEIDSFTFNVGAVLDRHLPIYKHTGASEINKYAKFLDWEIPSDGSYFNSGIMYVKESEISHKLYKEWHKIWSNTLRNKGISIDQPALAKANAILGYPITEIDGSYNCQIIENGLKYLSDAKIIHYYASNIGKWDCPYIFRDKSIYEKVRIYGIDNDMEILIRKAKSAFNEKTIVLAGNMCDAYYTTLSGIARRIFINMPKLSSFIDKFYSKIFI